MYDKVFSKYKLAKLLITEVATSTEMLICSLSIQQIFENFFISVCVYKFIMCKNKTEKEFEIKRYYYKFVSDQSETNLIV